MQCKAKSKQSKKRCRKQAINGGTVCAMHGGAAPQVKRKAKERFQELVAPAINRLEKIINDPQVSPGAAIAACRDIIDRAGHKPTEQLQVVEPVEVNDPGRDRLTDDQLDRLIALGEQLASSEGDQEAEKPQENRTRTSKKEIQVAIEPVG